MTALVDEFSFDHPQNKGCGVSNRLVPLQKSNSKYTEVEKSFRKGWKHPKKKRPRIYGVFRIALSDNVLKPFHRYRARVAAAPSLAGKIDNPSNEQLLFHGTTRCCLLEADDYTANPDNASNLRVVLASRVIVGKAYRRQKNATSLTEPPCGHHSVIGEPGIDLNYEETVVYDNDAIRPAYLVVYGDPPPLTNAKIIKSVITTLFKTPLAT
ncbi:hypothetical protein EST38_g5154 [Candolleomyces aberdarensis]|uniref:PARP catalytic domain-containing protein n=1 Tax=Candolleomyces aberdarensis TaxID=2316362 RepID=A0A4Q2DPB5_9AGAR|nr:hypothetical protein EST38_g5154 [Candolleomyces aberdarensis]